MKKTAAAALMMAGALLLAGCSGGDDDTTSASSNGGGQSPEQYFAENCPTQLGEGGGGDAGTYENIKQGVFYATVEVRLFKYDEVTEEATEIERLPPNTRFCANRLETVNADVPSESLTGETMYRIWLPEYPDKTTVVLNVPSIPTDDLDADDEVKVDTDLTKVN